MEGFLYAVDVAYNHAAFTFVLAQFAAAEVGGGIVDDAAEDVALVEDAVSVTDEI